MVYIHLQDKLFDVIIFKIVTVMVRKMLHLFLMITGKSRL